MDALEIHLLPLSTTETSRDKNQEQKKVYFVSWVILSGTSALLMTTNEKTCSEDQNPICGFSKDSSVGKKSKSLGVKNLVEV